MPKAKQPATFRDRVLGLERIPARELRGHDGNWRVHPQHQQEAMTGVLREVGIAGALLVYRSPEADGAYVVIDGHLRKALDGDQEWPCLVLDVDDDEARYLLATHDPLTTLAEADTEALRALLDGVQSGEASVQAMLAQLAEDTGIIPPGFSAELEENQGVLDQQKQMTCPACGEQFTP